MSFDEPDEIGGVRLNPRDVVGHLLLVWTIDYIAHSPTQFSRPDKPSDVIIVDAVDLDQVDESGRPGLLARKCWWRQAQLIQALRPKIGSVKPLLVRMTKGSATMGRNAPYTLTSMTADPMCVSRAEQWQQMNPEFTASKAMPTAPETSYVPETHSYIDPPPNNAYRNDLPPAVPPRPATPQEQSILERMARSSVQPGQGNQGPIPF